MQQLLFEPHTTTVINVPEVIQQPKFEPATTVINKILNVKKKNSARLSPADLAELNRYQQWFNEQNGKLDRWEMLFKFELEHQYPGNWKAERTRWGSFSLNIDKPVTENEFLDFEFDPEESLESINSQRGKLQEAFVKHILCYMRETYDLERFDDDNAIDKLTLTTFTYEPVIDYIFSILPHANLQDAAINAMISKFSKVMHGKNKAFIEKNKINIPAAGFYRFEKGDSSFMNFFTVLGYFETGQAGQPLFGEEIVIGSYKQSKTYQLGGSKITHVRFYQNGKALVYFANEMEANKFFNLF